MHFGEGRNKIIIAAWILHGLRCVWFKLKDLRVFQSFFFSRLYIHLLFSDCADGHYNKSSNCDQQCGNCTGGAACNKDTGHCPSCEPGWIPPLCQQRNSLCLFFTLIRFNLYSHDKWFRYKQHLHSVSNFCRNYGWLETRMLLIVFHPHIHWQNELAITILSHCSK